MKRRVQKATESNTFAVASSGLGHIARGIEAWAADLGRALIARRLKALVCKGGGTQETDYERVLSCWQRESKRTQRLLRWLPRRFFWRIGLGSPYDIEQTTFAWNLLKVLRKENVDILHVQDPRVALLVQKARRVGLVRTRTILAHGTEEPPEFLRRIDYLQHLAPWHLEDARMTGAWKPQWTAIPNFIDTELFHPGRGDVVRGELGIPPEAVVVLCVAAIKRHHKRCDYLLREFAQLDPAGLFSDEAGVPPIYLVVVGGWEKETDELISEGKSLLGDRVRFLVRFPRERMPELYRAANVFVLCSLKEMLGIVLLEATASGLPCLVHRHPVMQWVIGPGGEAIDMAQPGVLAAARQRLVTNPAGRLRLGEAARLHCLAHFSQERVVDQLLEYYEYVMVHDSGRRDATTAPYNSAS